MKMKYLKSVVIALAVSAGFAACQDFLEEKKNYQMTSPDLYNYYEGAIGRVNDIYAQCLPQTNFKEAATWHYPSYGEKDMYSKATEEYSGFSPFVHPLNELDTRTNGLTVVDHFVADASNIQENPWGLIRLINDAIEGIETSSLTAEQKEELLGQLYFFRAWRYFMMWKWYGGIPKIDFLPDITPGSVTPRSTTKEILDFIINDLDTSAELLAKYTVNGKWPNASADYGRITPSAALALKGRALVWWCSPLFNREGLESRYQQAYEIMKKDFDEVISTTHSLAPAKDATLSGWADMFQTIVNDEAVFFARMNNVVDGDYGRYNVWEDNFRPHNTKPQEGGGQAPSAMIVDMFPMRDGGVPNNSYFAGTKLKTSDLTYDADHPFLNRDLRFYRTFGFPGIKWTFNGGDPRNSNVLYPYSGNDYELWNYVWYEKADQRDSEISGSTYGPDALESHISGMYITKKTSSGNECGFSWDSNNGFQYSYASLIEIRYAEVLLNMAEIACGAGKMSEAVNNYLLPVRERAGYAGKQGLAANAESDKAACMAAILYERQIELAYEGKRFDDMRRWLLFDGGDKFSEVAGAPASWTLTGFGGNTCTWLGFKPLNGQRRENLEFRVKDDIENGLGKFSMPGKGEWDKLIDIDPIATNAKKEFGWTDDTSKADDLWIQFRNWRSGYVVDLNKCTSTTQLDDQLNNLQKFYDKYLVRKLKRGDERQPTDDKNITGMTVRYLPKYYFLGLTGTAQDRNPTLEQNIGWDGLGGNGTFDPLAE